jgi:hypothetical protein
MTDWTSLGIGLGLALLGGMLIALGSRRWSLCPLRECPPLEAGQRVEFTVAGKRYATVLTGVDGDALRIAPPLERGLPVSFEAGVFAALRLTTPSGRPRGDGTVHRTPDAPPAEPDCPNRLALATHPTTPLRTHPVA